MKIDSAHLRWQIMKNEFRVERRRRLQAFDFRKELLLYFRGRLPGLEIV
jgi:hypothetical protein